MSKTSYQNITELSADLSSKVGDLDKGDLSLDELEQLVQQANDLYQRLVVIRHKGYEELAKGEVVQEAQEQEKVVANSFVEKAIEEEVEEEEVVVAPQEEQPAFDFAFDMAEAEEEQPEESEAKAEVVEPEKESEEEEVEEPAVVQEEPKVELVEEKEEEVVEAPEKESEEAASGSPSLNDLLGDGELSLRKKLQNSPVKDIASEISLQKKYEYITDMFKGDNEQYEKAIQELNSCGSPEEAREKLTAYSATFEWSLENKSIVKFIELVERRYM